MSTVGFVVRRRHTCLLGHTVSHLGMSNNDVISACLAGEWGCDSRLTVGECFEQVKILPRGKHFAVWVLILKRHL